MSGKELTLGTLFKGKMDPSFAESIDKIKSLVMKLDTVLAKVGKAGGAKALSSLAKQADKTGVSISKAASSISYYSEAMGKAASMGKRFSSTLSTMAVAYKTNSLRVKDTEKAMYKVDGILRQLNREFNAGNSEIALSNKNWKYAKDRYIDYNKAADLTKITQKALTGEIELSRKGISDYISRVTKGSVTFDKFTNASKKAWPAIQKVNKAIDDGTRTWQSAAIEQSKYQASLAKLLPVQKSSANAIQTVTKASAKAWPAIEKMNRAIDSGNKSWQEVSRLQATYQAALKRTLPTQKQSEEQINKNKRAVVEAINAQKKALKVTADLQKEKTRLINKYSEHTRKLNEFLPKLDKEQMSVQQVTKAMDGYIKRQKDSAKAAVRNVEKKDKLLRQYPKLSAAVHKLDKQVRAGNISWDSASKHLQALAAKQKKAAASTQKFTNASKKAGKAITFLGKQIGTIDGAYNRFLGALKLTTSYGIAATAIYSVINAMKSGVQAIIDYDQGLKNLQAITGATDFEVASMGETIKQVARDTKFSTSEAADGMTLLGQAGLNAGESMTAMRDTALLATGTLSDMKTSTDLVSTTIRAFGMSATESGRIVDVMANAVNKSKLTIDKLRTAFNYVAATSSQAGLSIEETASTMMNLANNGLRASTIGTGFRQVLSKMVKPSTRLSEALASVGLKLDDINPSMVGWQGTLKSLSAILYDTGSKTVDMSKAFSLFGLRGAQAAAVVVKSFVSGKYQDALNKVYEIGTAEEMAGKQAEGLGVKLKNLIDRAGNVAVAFGEAGAADGIRVFLDAVRGALAALEDFVGSVSGQVVVQLAAVAGSFKLATMAAKGFMAVLGKVAIVKMATSTYATLTTTLGKGGLAGAFTTAGYMLEAFLKRLNPVTIGLGIIAGAVLTYRAVLNKALKDAEMLAVKNMQIVDSLEAYKGAMVSTGEKAIKLKDDTDLGKSANDAYIATLRRLIKAHPELTSKIEMSTDAYKRNNQAVREFTDASHDKKVRALVSLYNEYGEAGKRAAVWAGVWETIKAGLVGVGDATVWVLDKTTSLIQNSINYWGKFLVSVGKVVKALPLIGDMASVAFDKTGNALINLKSKIIDTYAEFGKGSASVKELSEKQQGVVDSLAQSYIGLGIKAKTAFNDIEKSLRNVSVGGEKISQEMINAVLEAVMKGRKAVSQYSNDVRSSLNEMSESWKAYYDTKDIAGQYAVQKAWERLQKEAKAYADYLMKKVKDNDISEKQMSDAMSSWWSKRLQEYQASLAKQTESHNKELEKRQAAYQRFADKIKSIETKLADDMKLLRQSGMSDAEKNTDDLISARQALADAVTAVSEATTAKELEEATKKVEIARSAYGDIVRAANTASSMEVKAQEKSTASKKAIKTEELGWYTTNWELAAAREQIWNNAVIENLKATRELYNKWYGRKAEERATADETAAKRMETAATEAFAVITGLLETLQEKFTKKNELNLNTKDAEKGVENVEKKVERVDTIVKDGKTYKIDTTKSVTDVGTLEAKAKEVGTIVTAEKTYKMDASGAITSVNTLKTGVTDLNKIVVDEQVYKINTEQSKTDIGNLATNAERVDSIVSKGVTYVVNADKSLTDTSALKTNVEKTNDAVSEEKTISIKTSAANKALDTTKRKSEDLKKAAEKTIVTELDGKQPNRVLDEIKRKLEFLESKVWKSKHVITVVGLAALKKAYDLHKRLDGMSTNSTHTTSSETGKKTGGPIGFDRGGKLHGYGGGDTVAAKLEKGEFVIRKEAVRKYGEKFFEYLNSMRAKFSTGGLVPGNFFEKLGSSMAKFSTGGVVQRVPMPSIAVPVQKFSKGGGVTKSMPQQPMQGPTYNITFAPQVMTGDRMAMRNAAVAFKEAIEQTNHRWGHAWQG